MGGAAGGGQSFIDAYRFAQEMRMRQEQQKMAQAYLDIARQQADQQMQLAPLRMATMQAQADERNAMARRYGAMADLEKEKQTASSDVGEAFFNADLAMNHPELLPQGPMVVENAQDFAPMMLRKAVARAMALQGKAGDLFKSEQFGTNKVGYSNMPGGPTRQGNVLLNQGQAFWPVGADVPIVNPKPIEMREGAMPREETQNPISSSIFMSPRPQGVDRSGLTPGDAMRAVTGINNDFLDDATRATLMQVMMGGAQHTLDKFAPPPVVPQRPAPTKQKPVAKPQQPTTAKSDTAANPPTNESKLPTETDADTQKFIDTIKEYRERGIDPAFEKRLRDRYEQLFGKPLPNF